MICGGTCVHHNVRWKRHKQEECVRDLANVWSTFHSTRNNTTAKYSTTQRWYKGTNKHSHTHTLGIWLSDFSLWRMMLEDRSLHIPDISAEQRVKFSKQPLQLGRRTHRPWRTVTDMAYIHDKSPVHFQTIDKIRNYHLSSHCTKILKNAHLIVSLFFLCAIIIMPWNKHVTEIISQIKKIK